VLALVGVGACPFAPSISAVGIDAVYPIYEEYEFWSTEPVVPSTLVVIRCRLLSEEALFSD
jgi:hypothetical protein